MSIQTPMLSVVVLAYNRREALLRTLRELAAQGLPGPALAGDPSIVSEVIVVDNASADGTAEAVARDHPQVQVLRLESNAGVAGFNRGAQRARGQWLLILDDDAWPDAGVLGRALATLHARADAGAGVLLPVHPSSGRAEWGFARAFSDAWPVMGCANLVRASAWRSVGGYEERFFLYRNDTDLALKLLGAGLAVCFDPSWRAWHDSPAAVRKSEGWLQLATRNWLWMCRRHTARGGAMARAVMASLGVVWAARLAGPSVRRLARVLRGVHEGLQTPAPSVPEGVRADGAALRRLMRLRLLGR